MRNRFPCSEHSFVLHTQKFCVFLIFQPHELMLSDVVTCKVGAFWLCIYLLWDATAGLIQMEPCVLHPSPVSSAVWSLLYGLLGKAERLLQINQLSQKPSFMHACTSWLFFSSEHRSIALGNLSKTLCWIFLQSLTSVATSPASQPPHTWKLAWGILASFAPLLASSRGGCGADFNHLLKACLELLLCHSSCQNTEWISLVWSFAGGCCQPSNISGWLLADITFWYWTARSSSCKRVALSSPILGGTLPPGSSDGGGFDVLPWFL